MQYSILFLIFYSSIIHQADAQWDQYFAKWEGKDGAVILDMSWHDVAPASQLPYVVETRLQYKRCSDKGFPDAKSYDQLEWVADSSLRLFRSYGLAELVGTFTHNCVQKNFYYVRDTNQIEIAAEQFLASMALFDSTAVSIYHDPKWGVYLNFLYPDDFLIQSMNNSRVIRELLAQGIEIDKRKELLHTAYLPTESAQNQFRIIVLEQGFRILDLETDVRKKHRFKITFERRDKLELDWINDVTIKLSERAEKLGGNYEGWELAL